MGSERGQATVEWTGVVLLVALVLGAAVAVVPVIDGRSFGAFVAQRILCALRGDGCPAHDDQSLDTHRSRSGVPATVFTHVVRRGGETFLQYWFYYPDSTTTVANAAGIWRRSPLALAGGDPGLHPGDWGG